MKFIDGAVFFEEHSLLCMADLHLGYEAELLAKGHHIPSSETTVLFRRIARILALTNPRTVVLNGDIKHTFGKIHSADWRHVRKLVDVLGEREIIVVSGNHDAVLAPVAEKFELHVVQSVQFGSVLFVHGDTLPKKIDSQVQTIVIGHEHPAIGITKGPRTEVVKCYLQGTWKKYNLIVLPSMFSLTEGTNILTAKLLSPFLQKNLASFRVFVLSEGEVLDFGTVKDVQALG